MIDDTKYSDLMPRLSNMFENQETLVLLESKELINGFGYSDTHCVDLIGKLDNPNVTKLAAEMNMTRGAISKTVKKLMAKDMIESYQLESNQKEIYYKLTDQGWELFEAHKARHQIWENRDKQFLATLDEETLDTVYSFICKYEKFLHDKIEMIKNG